MTDRDIWHFADAACFRFAMGLRALGVSIFGSTVVVCVTVLILATTGDLPWQ